MKSVAVVTIHSFNFGNRLQNYALQKIISDRGLSVCTLQRGSKNSLKYNIHRRLKLIAQFVVSSKGYKYYKFDKTIKTSRYYLDANEAPEDLKTKYDYFVAGSDQIWNPYFNFVGKSDLLYFAESNQKISYAASFGVSSLPLEKKEMYKEYLKDFSHLSVREEEGKNIVFDLIGNEPEVVLDPTLMLSAKEWRKVEKKSRLKPKKKYILVYMLGKPNQEFYKLISEFSNSDIDILDVFSLNRWGKELAIGPAEFIYLIDSADIIFTDSFHATVFSILFHKQFITFMRNDIDMSSRILTLVRTLGLEEKLSYNMLNCIGLEGLDELYKNVEYKLEGERIKSNEFLNMAFSVEH